ncbi:MAG: sodium-dependent transporter [Myxococcota bacterium]
MAGQPREHFTSHAGFVLAAVGSAVGLGNMWRFSYLAAENGGAAFVLLYLAMTTVIALPILLAEFAIGRGAAKSPVAALDHFGGPAWRPLGALFVASGFLILSYYSVISGWTLRYLLEGAVSGLPADKGAYFETVTTGWSPVLWHLGFMGLTVFVVLGGVQKGIQRTSLILMPTLFVLVLGLAVYAGTLPGAEVGHRQYLQPDLDHLFSLRVLGDAAGQAFFSLSLGMGAMLTYASYLTGDENLPVESAVVAAADFGVAFVAGLVVFPLVFALGLADDVGGSTVGALFITIPSAFATLGGAGRIVGAIFFVALTVGALTSAISLLEVVVASAIDRFGWSRRKAALSLGGTIAVLGLPSAASIDVLGLVDQIAGSVFLIAGGLGLSLFVGWRMPDPETEVLRGARHVPWLPIWRFLLRFPVPLALLAILLGATLPDTLAAVRDVAGG